MSYAVILLCAVSLCDFTKSVNVEDRREHNEVAPRPFEDAFAQLPKMYWEPNEIHSFSWTMSRQLGFDDIRIEKRR